MVNQNYCPHYKSVLSAQNKVARDSLFNELFSAVSHYGNLSVREKRFVVCLLAHKLSEAERFEYDRVSQVRK